MHLSTIGAREAPDLFATKAKRRLFVFIRVMMLGASFLVMPCADSLDGWAQSPPIAFKFHFGAEPAPKGSVQVRPMVRYSRTRGYGFEKTPKLSSFPRRTIQVTRSSLCGEQPFLFSIALPEGNYSVIVTLGDQDQASTTTVKAEARRLLLQKLHTAPGQFETETFLVNVRAPEIASGGRVQLKPAERHSFNWDDKLTLEFNDKRPCLVALQITRVDNAVTVYLAGDSTVVDQVEEPWAAWGQILPAFFDAHVAVANHAESAESLKSFIRERRLDKLLSTIKAGDYLLVQFAHNDQKQGPERAATHVDAFTTYKAYLKVLVQEARSRGAIPVFVTSMHRRSFEADGRIKNTLADYPEAMRQTAAEESVPLIDLNAMSKVLYEALGAERSAKAFVHYPAGTFPGQNTDLRDDTHFNAYGAYELAKCVVWGIQSNHLDLARFLRADGFFDPSHPDPVESFYIPASPVTTAVPTAGKGEPKRSHNAL